MGIDIKLYRAGEIGLGRGGGRLALLRPGASVRGIPGVEALRGAPTPTHG